MAGACGTENVMSGMAVMNQTTGDCKVDQCDGMGAVETVNDDLDLPADDGMQCTASACNNGMPEHNPVMAGTACTESNGSFCNGMTTCVQCTLNSHCMSGICTNNQCVMINECSFMSATDMTGMGSVTVNFGGMSLGNNYDPKCLIVSQGTVVTFSANGPASFVLHPLMGGEVINSMKVPAMMGTSPFVPITNMGTSAAFTMSNTGNFPYYCDVHALGGMIGAIFVVQ
jgi:plastocyanin